MEIKQGNKTAILFGASGLVGSHVLQFLLNHGAYSKVVSIGRRKLKHNHDKLEQYVLDFGKLKDYTDLMKGDDLFLCLGTTMAKAKTKSKFIRVDFTYPYHAAVMAKRNGANQVLLISSMGANSNSLIFYLKIKGETEKAIRNLNYWGTHIFRPSLLLGERIESRFGERIAARLGRGLDFLTGGLMTKIKPIEAEVVAKAMVNAAQSFHAGSFIYPSDKLQKLSEEENALRKYNQ